jgi:hypothetical protein
MSKFIEITGNLILKSSITAIKKIEKRVHINDYLFNVNYGDDTICIFSESLQIAEAERNRIIKELEE